ncbi:hypothetical protein RCIP0023_00277 [Klebsiella phage RCIP0023]
MQVIVYYTSLEMTEEYVFQLSTVHEYISAIIMIMDLKKELIARCVFMYLISVLN